MEIYSGTDPEPGVLKLICPYCQQTFETYEKIERHLGIHIISVNNYDETDGEDDEAFLAKFEDDRNVR